MTTWRVVTGDVRERVADLPDQSVQCVVTSPPYWGLRDYGHVGQIGLEASPEAYVSSLREVFAEVWRVLRDDGTVWINIGDSYAAGGHGGGVFMEMRGKTGSEAWAHRQDKKGFRSAPAGLKPKDLVGIPWRVAFALQADGWYLRSDIIWSKPNPMPESVTDRPTKAHEYIFLLSKSERYYFDAEAIKEAASENKPWAASSNGGIKAALVRQDGNPAGLGVPADGGTRNKRSVWHIATQPYPEAHFATFPEALIEPCILAGSRLGDTVLDPFTGSGTTGAVAVRHQRNFLGIELNPSYVTLARKRIGSVAPLLAREVA
jgi:DNA modification methylase